MSIEAIPFYFSLSLLSFSLPPHLGRGHLVRVRVIVLTRVLDRVLVHGRSLFFFFVLSFQPSRAERNRVVFFFTYFFSLLSLVAFDLQTDNVALSLWLFRDSRAVQRELRDVLRAAREV